MIITTTSSIQNFNIEKYISPISAHIVIGTNVFSDFFASVTDVFGGRSNTYQKKITGIYSNAIKELEKIAVKKRANCILGLHIDIREISGKGKSMFMITATGTAVIAKSKDSQKSKKEKPAIDEKRIIKQIISDENTLKNRSQLTYFELENLRLRKEVVRLFKKEKISISNEMWNFIIENSIEEILEDITRYVHLENDLNIEDEIYTENLIGNYKKYLNSIPGKKVNDFLYFNYINHKYLGFNGVFLSVIQELLLTDYEKIERYLKNEQVVVKRRALQLINIGKEFYSIQDIEVYENLISIIKDNFNEIDEMWQEDGRDEYGFLKNQLNPPEAISYLETVIEVIKETCE